MEEAHTLNETNEKNSVIRARAVVKRYEKYGAITAVDGVSFEIREGEIFGFLGPNGAGKTTIIKMITCTSPKTSGELTVLGCDVETRAREIKKSIGVVPQENNLDPDFSVYQNLLTYARYFDIPSETAERRAEELLGFLHLTEKKNTNVEKLSGGMKRRLIIARALMNEPKIVILDEPTTGLDPQARHLIWERVRELKKRNVTIVLTTHYMDEAARLCDRLVIMDGGKILVEGTPRELIATYAGHDVIELEPATAEVTAFVRAAYPHLSFDVFGKRLYLFSSNKNEGDEVFKALTEKFPFEYRVLRDATLEDIFLKLTGRGLRE